MLSESVEIVAGLNWMTKQLFKVRSSLGAFCSVSIPMSKRSLDTDASSALSRKRAKSRDSKIYNPSDALSFCHISKLSDEILLNVFQMLPLEQILSCQGVSHRWQSISTDPELWKRLYFIRFVRPRLSHVHSRTRTRIATRNWWNNERTQTEGEPRKDWKQLFKLRYNWHKGRCAVSEIDISNSPVRRIPHEATHQASFWNEPTISASPPLVQFNGKIFVAADKDAGLRAWDIGKMENGKRKLVGCRQFQNYEQGWRLGEPTALGIDGGGETTDVVVGFNTGGAMILQFSPTDGNEGNNFGFTVRFILPPALVPEKIMHVTYSHPYLLTLDAKYYLRAYFFDSTSLELDPPRSLATLQAQALYGPCNLTLRKQKTPGTVTASIAYSMPLFHGGWSVGIQEVILDISSPTGIAQTRIGTCIPSTYQLAIQPDQPPSHIKSSMVPVASPSSISYSHPYLLTSHRDNTLTLYLARSTDKEITIGQPRRLWGHTTGVARAGVAGQGRAVSVSQVGGEVRVWELENIAASVSKADSGVEDETVVGIIESVRVENASSPLRVGKELYLDNIPSRTPMAVEWIGFDDEKVLVVTRDEERDKNVTLYDFTF